MRTIKDLRLYEATLTLEDLWAATEEAEKFWSECAPGWRARFYPMTKGWVVARGQRRPAVAYGDPAHYNGGYDSIYYLLKSGEDTYAGARVAKTFMPRDFT